MVIMKIKARAWHTKKQIMYLPSQLGEDDVTLSVNGRGFLNVSGASTKLTQELTWLLPLLFIGKRDRNDNEIYEEDVVKLSVWVGQELEDWVRKEFTALVKWSDRLSCFYFLEIATCKPLSFFLTSGRIEEDEIEVLGDGFRNPELLK